MVATVASYQNVLSLVTDNDMDLGFCSDESCTGASTRNVHSAQNVVPVGGVMILITISMVNLSIEGKILTLLLITTYTTNT